MAGPVYPFDQFLSIRHAYGASFHADGRRIAFVSDLGGVGQAWTADLSGGWPAQVTFGEDRATSVEYAPRGDGLIVAVDAGGSERHQLLYLPEPGAPLVGLT